MAQPSPNVSPERLIDAADTLLEAIESHPDGFALVEVWRGKPADAPEHAFTAEELTEAMLFLQRLGFITATSPVKAKPWSGQTEAG